MRILPVVLAVALFSCQTQEKVDIPQADDFIAEKSAQITLTEVKVEAATTETEYEVAFFANAEKSLTKLWHMGKRFAWNGKLRYLYNKCPDVEITLDSAAVDGYPKTITLDYGDSTVLRNGRVLSGLIEIYITAPRKSKDYTREVTYTDFGIDSLTINGTSLLVVDKQDSTFRTFTSDLVIMLPDGTSVTRSSERTWQWLEGMDTEDDQSDDVILIDGFLLADLDGDEYKKEITTPLKRTGDCKYFVEGVVEITHNGVVICMIDYGDGTCDEFATMTNADGEVFEIDLSERKMHKDGENGKGKNKNKGNDKGNSQNNNHNGNQNGNNGNQNGNGNNGNGKG